LTNNLPTDVKTFIDVLGGLSERDRDLLINRFFKGMSMKEVAKQIGVTDSRVKQLEDKLIREIELSFELHL